MRTLGGLVAGTLVALSLPPWGWWPLAIVGVALLSALLEGRRAWARAGIGAATGLGVFAIGLFWMNEFTVPGYVIATAVEAGFVAAAAALVLHTGAHHGPEGRVGHQGGGSTLHSSQNGTGWGRWALPAALVLAEAARGHWPFGGVPLGGIALGQVGGPLAPAARLGGELLVVGVTAIAGVALAGLVAGMRRGGQRRRLRGAAAGSAVVVLLTVAGAAATAGRRTGELRVALVQGGGPRGFRAVDRGPEEAFMAQLAANRSVRPPVDLVLWPEDVIDVERLHGSAEAEAVAGEARRVDATLVAGVVEDIGPDHFRNAAVVWAPSGEIIDRFDKVHAVPFGEYVPGRRLVDRLADLSAIPRDMVPGRGPGVVHTPAGRLGVLVSYEVFFPARGRLATRGGGGILLVPTNASSYRTGQVPGQELAAARLRALESGRTVLQAAPTGYSAVVDPHGRVRARSRLGARTVLHREVTMRSGTTPAVGTGPAPVLGAACAALALMVAVRRRT